MVPEEIKKEIDEILLKVVFEPVEKAEDILMEHFSGLVFDGKIKDFDFSLNMDNHNDFTFDADIVSNDEKETKFSINAKIAW